jgi:hypothetical protein
LGTKINGLAWAAAELGQNYPRKIGLGTKILGLGTKILGLGTGKLATATKENWLGLGRRGARPNITQV